MPLEIKHPFSLSGGSVATTDDPDVQIRQHVHALVGTEPGERVMLPEYGVPVRSLVFSNVDGIEAQKVKRQIDSSMERYEPGAIVNSVEVVPTNETGRVQIRLNYSRRGHTNDGTRVNTAIIGVGGKVIEVIRG